MGCLSENTIQELVAGVLPGDARAQAHLHIETCTACRVLVIELARDGDLEGIPHPDKRSLFTGELHTIVNTEPLRDRSGLAPQIGEYEIIRLLG